LSPGSTSLKKYPLPKAQILRSRKSIGHLYANGKSLFRYPIKLLYVAEGNINTASPSPEQLKVLFAVSKKRYPRAVDRNKIKRLMRESFRKEQPPAYPISRMVIIYVGKSIVPQSQIGDAIKSLLISVSKLSDSEGS